MGIKANFNKSDISSFLDGFQKSVIDKTVQALGLLGTKCVNNARELPKEYGFEDHTGNLRSSIGFKVFVGGKPMMSDYRKVQPVTKSEGVVYDGMERGESLADSVGADCGDTTVMLVVTAGMEYAVHVESKGHRVISSAEQLANQLFPEYMKKIEAMVRRQMKGMGK